MIIELTHAFFSVFCRQRGNEHTCKKLTGWQQGLRRPNINLRPHLQDPVLHGINFQEIMHIRDTILTRKCNYEDIYAKSFNTLTSHRVSTSECNHILTCNRPQDVAGTFFSGVLSDHAVLQRAPALAAVMGVVIGAMPSTTVTVSVSSEKGESYNVQVNYPIKYWIYCLLARV